jgi:3-hydroxyisobutyrate dehydrogenase-like beta-hydroxyacid dehydrogenase
MTQHVAFLGLGRMGSGMAARLLQAGFQVTAYNRTRARAEALVAAGGLAADTPRDAVKDADLVVSMLADDEALLALALGEAGFVDSMRPGTVHLSMSTVSPAATRSLSAEHEARGTWLVAATVLGRPDRAASGELRIVAAGPRVLEERCRPLFNAMSSGYIWISENQERANVFKIVLNFTLLGLLELTAEALTLAERNQIDREQYRQFVAPLFANVVDEYAPRMMAGAFEPAGFSSFLALKDARLAFELADESHTLAPLAGLVHDHLLESVAHRRGEWDVAGVVEVLREQAGLRPFSSHML